MNLVLLLKNGKNLVAKDLYELSSFPFSDKFNNTGKHGEFSFREHDY